MLYYKVHQTKDLKKEDVAVHNYAKLSLCSNNKNFFPLISTLVADREGNMAAEKYRRPPNLGLLVHENLLIMA